jgi:hypothetical protein
LNSTPIGYAVLKYKNFPGNGSKRPSNAIGGFNRNGNKPNRRSLMVMKAMPSIEGATSFDIINDHYDRQFNVAICGATGNVGRQMLTVLEE